MNIEDQKVRALEVLRMCQLVDPFAIVAGGAVRDWRLEKPAQDIDIYLRMPNHNTLVLVEKFLMLGVGARNVKQLTKQTEHTYAELPHLKWVFEAYYKDLKFNFMIMEEGVRSEIVWNFDVAICLCYWDGQNYVYHPDFDFALKTNICTINHRYTGKEAHVRKMAERFPMFRFVKDVFIPKEPEVRTLDSFNNEEFKI
ncbi:nucleotidyltransferase [Escherichia phage alia]|uniref:Uncharacterized protein n=1 Tax=Escherichia phage alia TaxID=2696379 RepID=A0A6B9X7B2_9CAUD|nr:nucleotidyltransferase [Escherichia phage alia]QHR73752.1 hypothetical protein alia_38 [Escherichia phage alia]